MSLNNISFNLGQGGLGRPLPNEDHISGLVFYTASLPSGFNSNDRIKQIFSTVEAEALGIKDDYSDATAAAGSVTITTAGTNGDTINVAAQTPTGVVNFGTYIKAAGEANVTAVGDKVAALVNGGTTSHGFTAVNTAGAVAVTAPKKYGVYLNTGSKLITTIVGATLAATTVQFTNGVASKQAVWHYHIDQFFRMNPKAYLYVGFFAVPGSYVYDEVATIQNYAGGKIRQVGVYKDGAALATADLTNLSNACAAQMDLKKDLIGVIGADISGTSDLTLLPDLAALNAPWAQADIGQDGGALGAFLFATYGKSITSLGATLGAISFAKVSDSVAWVEKFNISDGTEFDVPAIANGALVRTLSDGLLSSIQDKALNFLRTFVGVAGSYRNESRTAVAVTSDYAYTENDRTIQKAKRGVYTSLIPALNSPITLNKNGTMTDATIEYFDTLARKNLYQMERDAEISNHDVAINPAQNILQTGVLVIAISIQPIGVARNIVVNIGFNVKISA